MKRRLLTGIACALALGGKVMAAGSGLLDCRAIAEAEPRLACYDALAADADTAPPALPASATPATATSASASASAQFGHKPSSEERQQQRIEARVLPPFSGLRKGTRFTLDNGQVWEVTQINPALEIGESTPLVVIRHAALGSYEVQVEGYNRRAKVKRIQ